ncbi:hypothetical protein FHS23_002174 [Prauserella isguenensis]|uniref:Uncharacterized protein n=1 Tax=Prauserella isguenensis TaxID=1470180 RepID=A0A839RZB9_9PSEU|nr:hypothetical protein [Prauserella isguenensis]MBB3051151.1 hypothetical protein [Prauserella isguenensis]
MSHQLDRVIDDVDTALRQLRRATRGMPINEHGFRNHHNKAARAMAELTTELIDARSAIDK